MIIAFYFFEKQNEASTNISYPLSLSSVGPYLFGETGGKVDNSEHVMLLSVVHRGYF